jgi:uncharacterized protein YaaN involved in tellurite resistance
MTKKIQEETDEVLILKRDLDNIRRSRDYFRQDRDDLKKMHEEMLSSAHNRINLLENKYQTLDGNVERIASENNFIRMELDIAERDVTFWKTTSVIIGLFSSGLIGYIIFSNL